MVDFDAARAHIAAIAQAERALWFRQPFVAIDVETTGLDPYADRIVEVGLARFEDGKCVWSGSRFVHPERDPRLIDFKLLKLTRIDPKQLMDAPPFWKVFNELAPVLEGAYPIAYHAPFDGTFFMHSVARSWPRKAFVNLVPVLSPDHPWIDACALARHCLTGLYGYRLGDVVRACGLPKREKHAAEADAISCGEIAVFLARMNGELRDELPKVFELQRQSAARAIVKKRYEKLQGVAEPAAGAYTVIECDVCRKVEALFGDVKLPEGWASYDRNLTTCGPACDIIAGWWSARW